MTYVMFMSFLLDHDPREKNLLWDILKHLRAGHVGKVFQGELLVLQALRLRMWRHMQNQNGDFSRSHELHNTHNE